VRLNKPLECIFIALLTVGIALTSNGWALETAHLHVAAGISPNSLLYRYSVEKGLYKEEGLDVLPVQAGMLPGIQGLVGGNFDFTQILGQSAAAILRGIPLKIIMAFDTRPLNWLYGSKNIRTLQDLKGNKQIAVSSFGAALDQMTRELLLKNGIDPQRDVILRAVEPTPNRLAALMNGAIDAAVLNQLDALIARKNGFHELLFYGDHLEFVTAGIAVTEKTLAQRPEFVQRFVRGTLRGFWWFKSNEKELVSRISGSMKISESEAVDVYRAAVRVMSLDGTISPGLQNKMLVLQRKALKIEREVPPESVYDFSMVRSVNKELGKAGY
jgi:ABC-type nitrate/sulfonate/bicarbonate transport system substrate-binding protein